MRLSRKLALAGGSLLAAVSLLACSSSGGGTPASGNAAQNKQQNVDSQQLAFVQPIPYFPYSQIRQTLIEAEAIQALGIPSTTFYFVQGINHPILQCPSIGVPVPATDQLTNPYVPQWNSGSGGNNAWAVAGVPVGQEDPTGVFTGDTSGTNNLCLDKNGNQYLGYDEAFTVAVTAPAYWDKATGTIKITGAPVMPVCKVVILDAKKHKAEEVCSKPKS